MYNLQTNIMLNNSNDYNIVKLIFGVVGCKPKACLCLSDELCNKSNDAIRRVKQYLINGNQDETITYDNITTIYIANAKCKIHKFTNYIIYEYIYSILSIVIIRIMSIHYLLI